MQHTRCQWLKLSNPEYVQYHDTQWGVPVYEDKALFEMLVLEGAQAGLSWETVLKKREGYRNAFFNFDINKCAVLTDEYLESQRENSAIIRNKLKIFSVRKNAIAAQKIQKEYGSLSNFLWSFVDHSPIQNNWNNISQVPTKTERSDTISKELKKYGMSFVGSTIIYAFMQATGMVNDHTTNCFCHVKQS